MLPSSKPISRGKGKATSFLQQLGTKLNSTRTVNPNIGVKYTIGQHISEDSDEDADDEIDEEPNSTDFGEMRSDDDDDDDDDEEERELQQQNNKRKRDVNNAGKTSINPNNKRQKLNQLPQLSQPPTSGPQPYLQTTQQQQQQQHHQSPPQQHQHQDDPQQEQMRQQEEQNERRENQYRKSYTNLANVRSPPKKHISSMEWQAFSSNPGKSKLFILVESKYQKLTEAEINGSLSSQINPREERSSSGSDDFEYYRPDLGEDDIIEQEQDIIWSKLKTIYLYNNDRFKHHHSFNNFENIDNLDYDEGNNNRKKKSLAYVWMTKDPFSLVNWRAVGSAKPILEINGSTIESSLNLLEVKLATNDAADEEYYCDSITEEFNKGLRRMWNSQILQKCVILDQNITDLNKFITTPQAAENGLDYLEKLDRMISESKEELIEFLLRHAAKWTSNEVRQYRRQQVDPYKNRQCMAQICLNCVELIANNAAFHFSTTDVYKDGNPVVKPDEKNIKLMMALMGEYRNLTNWKPEGSPYTNRTAALQAGYTKTSATRIDQNTNSLITSEVDAITGYLSQIHTTNNSVSTTPTALNLTKDKSGGVGKGVKRITNSSTMGNSGGSNTEGSKKKISNLTIGSTKIDSNEPPKDPSVQVIRQQHSVNVRKIRKTGIGMGDPKVLAGARNKKQVPENLTHFKKYPMDQFDRW